ncbi:IS1 family transposase [Aeromonas sp. QDB30]
MATIAAYCIRCQSGDIYRQCETTAGHVRNGESIYQRRRQLVV